MRERTWHFNLIAVEQVDAFSDLLWSHRSILCLSHSLSLTLSVPSLHTTELYYLSALSAGQQMLLLPCLSADAAATAAAATATSREQSAHCWSDPIMRKRKRDQTIQDAPPSPSSSSSSLAWHPNRSTSQQAIRKTNSHFGSWATIHFVVRHQTVKRRRTKLLVVFSVTNLFYLFFGRTWCSDLITTILRLPSIGVWFAETGPQVRSVLI